MLKHLLHTFFSRVSVALLNFLVLLLTSRWLGSAVLGQASLLILNIGIVHAVNEMYTGYVLVHFIPGQNLRKIYTTGLLWTLLCSSLINLLYAVVNGGQDALWWHAWILSIAVSLHSFHCVILLGRERFKTYNFLIFLQPFLMTASLAALVLVARQLHFGSYLSALYVAYLGSLLASTIAIVPVVRESGREEGANTWAILRKGVVNQLGNLAHTLSNRYNYYIIGSAALVGVYSGATSLIESVWIVGNSITPIVLSRAANKKDDPLREAQLTFSLAKASFLLSTVCVAVVALLPDRFFSWLLGSDFTEARSVMLQLSPGILAISFSTVISHYFSGHGNQRTQLIANLVGLLITVLSAPLLVGRYGLAGACYSASLAYIAQAAFNSLVFMQQNKLPWWRLMTFDARELMKRLRNP